MAAIKKVRLGEEKKGAGETKKATDEK